MGRKEVHLAQVILLQITWKHAAPCRPAVATALGASSDDTNVVIIWDYFHLDQNLKLIH